MGHNVWFTKRSTSILDCGHHLHKTRYNGGSPLHSHATTIKTPLLTRDPRKKERESGDHQVRRVMVRLMEM